MLDLAAKFNHTFYDVKLFDGTELHLKRPTQALQQYMLEFAKNVDKTPENEMLPLVMGLFVRVLNRNSAGKTFTVEELNADYDYSVATYVVQDYFLFWNGQMNVDFQATQQQ